MLGNLFEALWLCGSSSIIHIEAFKDPESSEEKLEANEKDKMLLEDLESFKKKL